MYIPVGIFNGELFMTDSLTHTDVCGHMIFCVVRPVSVSDLERYQSDEFIYDDCDDLWRDRVNHDKKYTGSLDDFVEEVKAQYGCDEENYPFKDESFCDVFEDETDYMPLPDWEDYEFEESDLLFGKDDKPLPVKLRKFVDMYIEFETGEAVGTWEASGCFSPCLDRDYHKPAKFDYVLNERAANIWYKQVGLI